MKTGAFEKTITWQMGVRMRTLTRYQILHSTPTEKEELYNNVTYMTVASEQVGKLSRWVWQTPRIKPTRFYGGYDAGDLQVRLQPPPFDLQVRLQPNGCIIALGTCKCSCNPHRLACKYAGNQTEA